MREERFGSEFYSEPAPAAESPPLATFDDSPRRRRGCMPGGCFGGCLVGCAVVFGIILLGVAILAGVGFYLFRDSFTTDPAKSAEVLQKAMPCEVPAAYHPTFSFKFEISNFKMAMVALETKRGQGGDESVEDIVFVLAFQGVPENALAHELEKQQRRRGRDRMLIEKTEQLELPANGKSLKTRKTTLIDENKVRFVEYQVMVKPGAMVIGLGQEAKFDLLTFVAFVGSVK